MAKSFGVKVKISPDYIIDNKQLEKDVKKSIDEQVKKGISIENVKLPLSLDTSGTNISPEEAKKLEEQLNKQINQIYKSAFKNMGQSLADELNQNIKEAFQTFTTNLSELLSDLREDIKDIVGKGESVKISAPKFEVDKKSSQASIEGTKLSIKEQIEKLNRDIEEEKRQLEKESKNKNKSLHIDVLSDLDLGIDFKNYDKSIEELKSDTKKSTNVINKIIEEFKTSINKIDSIDEGEEADKLQQKADAMANVLRNLVDPSKIKFSNNKEDNDYWKSTFNEIINDIDTSTKEIDIAINAYKLNIENWTKERDELKAKLKESGGTFNEDAAKSYKLPIEPKLNTRKFVSQVITAVNELKKSEDLVFPLTTVVDSESLISTENLIRTEIEGYFKENPININITSGNINFDGEINLNASKTTLHSSDSSYDNGNNNEDEVPISKEDADKMQQMFGHLYKTSGQVKEDMAEASNEASKSAIDTLNDMREGGKILQDVKKDAKEIAESLTGVTFGDTKSSVEEIKKAYDELIPELNRKTYIAKSIPGLTDLRRKIKSENATDEDKNKEKELTKVLEEKNAVLSEQKKEWGELSPKIKEIIDLESKIKLIENDLNEENRLSQSKNTTKQEKEKLQMLQEQHDSNISNLDASKEQLKTAREQLTVLKEKSKYFNLQERTLKEIYSPKGEDVALDKISNNLYKTEKSYITYDKATHRKEKYTDEKLGNIALTEQTQSLKRQEESWKRVIDLINQYGSRKKAIESVSQEINELNELIQKNNVAMQQGSQGSKDKLNLENKELLKRKRELTNSLNKLNNNDQHQIESAYKKARLDSVSFNVEYWKELIDYLNKFGNSKNAIKEINRELNSVNKNLNNTSGNNDALKNRKDLLEKFLLTLKSSTEEEIKQHNELLNSEEFIIQNVRQYRQGDIKSLKDYFRIRNNEYKQAKEVLDSYQKTWDEKYRGYLKNGYTERTAAKKANSEMPSEYFSAKYTVDNYGSQLSYVKSELFEIKELIQKIQTLSQNPSNIDYVNKLGNELQYRIQRLGFSEEDIKSVLDSESFFVSNSNHVNEYKVSIDSLKANSNSITELIENTDDEIKKLEDAQSKLENESQQFNKTLNSKRIEYEKQIEVLINANNNKIKETEAELEKLQKLYDDKKNPNEKFTVKRYGEDVELTKTQFYYQEIQSRKNKIARLKSENEGLKTEEGANAKISQLINHNLSSQIEKETERQSKVVDIKEALSDLREFRKEQEAIRREQFPTESEKKQSIKESNQEFNQSIKAQEDHVKSLQEQLNKAEESLAQTVNKNKSELNSLNNELEEAQTKAQKVKNKRKNELENITLDYTGSDKTKQIEKELDDLNNQAESKKKEINNLNYEYNQKFKEVSNKSEKLKRNKYQYTNEEYKKEISNLDEAYKEVESIGRQLDNANKDLVGINNQISETSNKLKSSQKSDAPIYYDKAREALKEYLSLEDKESEKADELLIKMSKYYDKYLSFTNQKEQLLLTSRGKKLRYSSTETQSFYNEADISDEAREKTEEYMDKYIRDLEKKSKELNEKLQENLLKQSQTDDEEILTGLKRSYTKIKKQKDAIDALFDEKSKDGKSALYWDKYFEVQEKYEAELQSKLGKYKGSQFSYEQNTLTNTEKKYEELLQEGREIIKSSDNINSRFEQEAKDAENASQREIVAIQNKINAIKQENEARQSAVNALKKQIATEEQRAAELRAKQGLTKDIINTNYNYTTSKNDDDKLKQLIKLLPLISKYNELPGGKANENINKNLTINNIIEQMKSLSGYTDENKKEFDNLINGIINGSVKGANALKQLKFNENGLLSGDTTPSPSESDIKKWKEYDDLIAVGYDRQKKMEIISQSGTSGNNSVYDLLRLNHPIWDEVKANNFFNTIPEDGLKRYNAILEVVERIVKEMVEASGLTEEQIVSQLKNIKSAQGGYFKANGNDSGWSHFATYSDSQNKDVMNKPNGITYKVYAAFDDIKDLNENIISSLMEELSKAGFKGRLKTTTGSTSFGDKLNGLAITDQLVVHGSSKKDQEIAYNTIKNFLGNKLSYLGGGIDTPDGSFSETLRNGTLGKYLSQIQQESQAAQQAAKSEHELAEARKEASQAAQEQPNKSDISIDAKPAVSEVEQLANALKVLLNQSSKTKEEVDAANNVFLKLANVSSESGKKGISSFFSAFKQGYMDANEASECILKYVEAEKRVNSSDFDNKELELKDLLLLWKELNTEAEKAVLLNGDKIASKTVLGKLGSVNPLENLSKEQIYGNFDTILHSHRDNGGTFSPQDVKSVVNSWDQGVRKITLVVDDTIQRLDFSQVGKEKAEEFYNAFSSQVENAKKTLKLDPKDLVGYNNLKEDVFNKVLKQFSDVKLEPINIDLNINPENKNSNNIVSVQENVKEKLSETSVKVDELEGNMNQSSTAIVGDINRIVEAIERLIASLDRVSGIVPKDKLTKYWEEVVNEYNQLLTKAGNFSSTKDASAFNSALLKYQNAGGTNGLELLPGTNKEGNINTSSLNKVTAQYEAFKQTVNSTTDAVNTSTAAIEQHVQALGQVSIAAGSYVSINGSVKIDEGQFTELNSLLINIKESLDNAIKSIISFNQSAPAMNNLANSLNNVAVATSNVEQQVQNVDTDIKETVVDISNLGQKVKVAYSSKGIDVSKYTDLRIALDAINKALEHNDNKLYKNLKDVADISAIRSFSKVKDDSGKIVKDKNGKAELEERITIMSKFITKTGELISMSEEFSLDTDKKGNIIAKSVGDPNVIYKVSNAYTMSQEALHKLNAELDHYANVSNKIKIRANGLGLQDFSIDENGDVIGKTEEAQNKIQNLSGIAKKAIKDAIIGLNQLDNAYKNLVNQSNGAIDETAASTLNNVIETANQKMNAVNRQLITGVEHATRSDLASLQKELNGLYGSLYKSDLVTVKDELSSGLNAAGQESLRQYIDLINQLEARYIELYNSTDMVSEDQKKQWKSLYNDAMNLKKLLYSDASKTVSKKGTALDNITISDEQIAKMRTNGSYALELLGQLAEKYHGAKIESSELSKDNQTLSYSFLDGNKNLVQATMSVERYADGINNVYVSTKKTIPHLSIFQKVIQGLKGKLKNLAQYFGAYRIFYRAISIVRNAINEIKTLDTALVDLSKTFSGTDAELNQFYLDSNKIARQMGVTTQAIIDQASAWSRLGYNTIDTASQMAALSSQFASISPGMEVDTATNGLVSVMKAFGIETDDVKRKIMDNINTIGNNFALSNDDVIEGLSKSSAAMNAANNSLEETIALFTAGQEVLQNSETMGQSLKTISMRIRGYDEETEELSEDYENLTGVIADLTKTSKTPGGISLFTDETKQTYKSTYEILKEISEIWGDLEDKNQAKLLEKLFGKTRAQAGAAILTNFEQAEKAMQDMDNAAGSSDKEMEKIENSIEYKINSLKEAWVGAAQEIISRDDFKWVIDRLIDLSEAAIKVIDVIGAVPTAIGAIVGIDAIYKNIRGNGGGRAKIKSLLSNKYASEELTVRFTRFSN